MKATRCLQVYKEAYDGFMVFIDLLFKCIGICAGCSSQDQYNDDAVIQKYSKLMDSFSGSLSEGGEPTDCD